MSDATVAALGVVIIGRNEGERLKLCVASMRAQCNRIVYVDSGSTDGSAEWTVAQGIETVSLDPSVPFTAARARNAGFERLTAVHAQIELVQFIDGDCEIISGWFEKAVNFLDVRPEVAVVCGRLRERYPERSIYNMLCNLEWDTPVGDTKGCGGIAMMRVSAFESARGFRVDLIAGEEPELCVRLRAAGWRIWRIDVEMALHDAAMTRFSQWWKRTVRGGYAFAMGSHLHGAPPERYGVRETLSAWIWGLGIPVGAMVLFLWFGGLALFLLLVYPLQIVRLALRGRHSARENWWHAAFLVLGRFPEMFGQMKFLYHRFLGGPSQLIEYK